MWRHNLGLGLKTLFFYIQYIHTQPLLSMKQILFLTVFVTLIDNLIAQQNVTLQDALYFNQSGNHTDGFPYARFDESYGIRFNSPNPKWVFSSKPSVLIGYQPDGTNWGNDNLYVLGKIGVGTSSPTSKLDVNGDIFSNANPISWRKATSGNGNQAREFIGIDGGVFIHHDNVISSDPTALNSFSGGRPGTTLTIKNSGNGAALTIPNGNVGIGTITPDPSFKLSVNGSIRSKEVKVEANWSDFVFYDNYELRTLEEVEKHINEKGHLPEIPSEAEVTENGINLGEMNAKLLQKIEELTLYMIDMNEQLKSQSDRMKQLEQENSELKKEVSDLKK